MSAEEHARARALWKGDDEALPADTRTVSESRIEPYTEAERAMEAGIVRGPSKQQAQPSKKPARVGPLADAMVKLAAEAGVEIVWPDERLPTADELRALPSTDRLEAELSRCQAELERWGAGRTAGLGWEHRTLMVKVAERHVRWGWLRDKIEANWTADCQCYGDGKIYVRPVNDERGETIEAGYIRYCTCPAGDALRASHGKAKQIAEERRTGELSQAIFAYGGDDFAEYADVTLDSYLQRLNGCTMAVQSRAKALVSELYLWSASKTAPWLVLTGPTGTGKTGMAISLLRLFASYGQRGLIVREKAMLDRIRATYNRQRGSDDPTETDVLDVLRRVPLLVIDDMAAPGSATSDWAQGQLFDVLNARYSARRRTIITSNLDAQADDLAAYVGPRIWSRIVERTEQERWLITVSDPDLRQGAA